MIKGKEYIAVFAALAFLILVREGGASVGAQTMQKNLSPRAESVGMAYTALVDDVYAIYWNPAALSYMSKSEISAAYASGLSDDYLAHVSYAHTADRYHTWGLGFLIYSSGPFEHIDRYGQSTAYTSVKTDWMFAFSNAFRPTRWWRFGFTLELFHSNLLSLYNATTLALILGNSIQLDSGFRIDMTLKHLGFPLTYGEEDDSIGIPFGDGVRETLPLTVSAGLAYDVFSGFNVEEQKLQLVVEANKVLLEPYRFNLGMEYEFLEQYSLRAGYQFNDENKWLSFGAGLIQPISQTMDIKLDYAFSFSELLNDQHKISLSVLNLSSSDREAGAQVMKKDTEDLYNITAYKIGAGVGKDYGYTGINFEAMAAEHIGLYMGLGLPQILYSEYNGSPPKASLGSRFYIGGPTAGFRGKASLSLSNGISAIEGHDYDGPEYTFEIYPEVSLGLGFQWRITEFMSWDADVGATFGILTGGTATVVEMAPAVTLGLMFHIPKIKSKRKL